MEPYLHKTSWRLQGQLRNNALLSAKCRHRISDVTVDVVLWFLDATEVWYLTENTPGRVHVRVASNVTT
jgi:hypothetical protein